MNLERREKYAHQGKTISFTNKRVHINLSLDVLNIMCSYVISENKNIKKGQLINMRNLFALIDLDIYANEPEKINRINFIRKGLEGRILHGLNDSVLILKYINGGITEKDNPEIKFVTELSTEELNWINNSVSVHLKYCFIDNEVDKMQELCIRYKAGDYNTIPGIVDEFEKLINSLQAKFRRVKVENASEITFSLKDGKFNQAVEDIYNRITNPSSRLITACQGLNELIGGSYEGGREYIFAGLAGTGKSLFLLDEAIQIKKSNKNYKPKDPTKIPVILYLTMENSVKESVERLFEMTTNKEMENYTIEEVINMLRTEGELYLNDESPIDILIKFVPNRSVDTSYLYTITEDLEDEGYEVICLLQDHVKRIRAASGEKDLRLELGDVVNEFHTFAVIKDIPVITVTHLNRDAARNIDEGAKNNKTDLLRMVGRSNIGESLLMMDNTDGMFLMSMEYDQEGNKYMGFSRVKNRFKATNRTLVYIPYTAPTSIKLVEDIAYQVPLFRDTLKSNTESNLFDNGIKVSPYQDNIKDIDELLQNNNSNPFNNIEENKETYSIKPSNFIKGPDDEDNNELEVVMRRIEV